MNEPLLFQPRGIGANTLRCCLCGAMKIGWSDFESDGNYRATGRPAGHRVLSTLAADGVHYRGDYHSCQPDMASHVASRENGIAVQELLNSLGVTSFLDYRESEPNWVQVKLGACDRHVTFLEHLQVCVAVDGGLTANGIRIAIEFALSQENPDAA